MKKIYFSCIALLLANVVTAQGTVEALRYSQVYHSGTARFSAMGGAFAALGGDATTLTYNPAGLGVYRSGEFTFTPHLLRTHNKASYMGNSLTDDKYKFGLSNLAGISTFQIGDNNDVLRFLNFGISYNKTNHFSESSLLQGGLSDVGIVEYFKTNADGIDPRNLKDGNAEAWLAYQTYGIDYDTATGDYFVPLNNGDQTYDEQRSFTKGMMGEWAFSIGCNFSDILYLGVTMGVMSINYEQQTTLSEHASINNTSDFEKLEYTRKYSQSGSGYNFKFGVLCTPLINADFGNGLRIGAAIHTPTFLAMRDTYDADMKTWFLPAESYKESLPTYENEYAIETPTKYMAGLAYVFQGNGVWRGILSADYEYVDYSQMKLREKTNYPIDYVLDVNRDITRNFRSTSNLRLGSELGYKQVSMRAGYARYANPYASSVSKDGSVQMFSAGLGFNLKYNTRLDLAYTLALQEDKSYLYYNGIINSPEVKYNIAQHNILLTLLWRF
ncbi:transporter [Bacteroidia bacterium]|nr:transporter [Bacteroidia bacterium]